MGKSKVLSALSLLILCLLAASCTAPTREAVMSDLEANGPASGYYIQGVPFYPQEKYMCGPAALASVIGYWGGRNADPGMKEIAKEVYEEKLKGTLPIDMLIYAKERGYGASYYKGGIEDLKEKMRDKKPLILFLNLGFEEIPIGHYIVAVGYDDRLKAVIAHSGTKREEVYTYERLLKPWSRTGFSTLLIEPKDREPKDHTR